MADTKQPSSTVKDPIEFLRLARERYTYALAVDRIDREEAAEDVKFVAGDQWHKGARDAREACDRPVLTENKLGVYCAKVVNDGRQSKPSIRLTALDGGKKETAEMLQGRVRHIEYESDADVAYDTAREQQVTSGRGSLRVTTRYKRKSSEQEIRIEPIQNQFSVLWDPNAKEYDKSDAEYCFVLTSFSKSAFERKFGKDTELVRNAFYNDVENPAPDWVGTGVGGENIQVAEYWQREDTEVTQYIIDGVEIHDETPWLGETIPIVPFFGKQMIVEGVLRNYSLIRFAKDPQRLVNLYVSNIAEQIAQMPKSPYIVAEGQIANHEEEWENINLVPTPVVSYRPVVLTVNGQQVMAPMPHRETNEPPIQALTIGLNQAIDAIKAAMGIFDASLGAESNETSGIAIQKRKLQSDNANFHFHDNEARSRKRVGRILLELLPLIDSGEKTVMTRTEDGKTTPVRVNTPEPYRDDQTGEMVHHQLDQGEYGVAISTGPSQTSARQEAFDTYSQIASVDKNFMAVAGDILFRNLDAPGSDAVADRYEKGVIPPALRPQQPGQQAEQQQQAQQQQMQVLMQQHQALVEQLHTLSQEIETKQVEMKSRERIAAMQEETKRSIAFAELNQQQGVELLRQEISTLQGKYEQIHERVMQQSQQDHEASESAADRLHEQTQQATAQQASADSQASAQAATAQQAAQPSPDQPAE